MAKQSGLGDNLYVGGYDISGDVGAVQTINASQSLLDVTAINKSAMERLGALRDGEISYSNIFFNDGAGQAHATHKALRAGADVHAMYCRGTTLGNHAACLIGKQVTYNLNRGADASLLGDVQVLGSAGYGLEWGRLLTAGKVTSTADENITSVDMTAAGTQGLVAYLQVFSLTGNDATFTLQESSNNGAGDAFAAVVGGAFTQVTTAPNTQRIATAAIAVERYLRVAVTGDYTNVVFAIAVIVPGAHGTV